MIRYAILLVVLFASCRESAVVKKLSVADQLEVRYTQSGSDVIEKYVTTTDKNAIQAMAHFLDNSPAEQFKCGYDGMLIFFEKGEQMQTVDFKYREPGCMHFSCLFDGKVVSVKMSREAADMLEALFSGKKTF